MKQLESLDVYRTAQDLGVVAYGLTLYAPLKQHFALADQIRRSAISIPANIAEGYALGTTIQFIRCLRIALGSTAELRSHLEVTKRLKLFESPELQQSIDLTIRVISMLVGLLHALSKRTSSRFPFPVSRFPARKRNQEPPS